MRLRSCPFALRLLSTALAAGALALAACAPPGSSDGDEVAEVDNGGAMAPRKDAGGGKAGMDGGGSGAGGSGRGGGGGSVGDGATASGGSGGAKPATDGGLPAGDAGGMAGTDGTKPPTPVKVPEPGQSGPLPVLMIDTGGKTIPRPDTTKVAGTVKFIEDHDGTFDAKNPAGLDARPVAFQSPIGINLRGNASANPNFIQNEFFSYNLELRNDKGEEQGAPVLGLGKGSEFALVSCYIDVTCMKNNLAYTITRELGGWAPRIRFVEVFINKRYRGVFLFTEKIERDNERLDIPKLDPASPDVTGSYIYKVDSPSEGREQDWVTPGGYTLTHVYPKIDKITDAQKAYIRKATGDFDTVLASATYADPEKGYRSLIDVKSWVNHFLVNELSNNADGLVRSAFFYKLPQSMGGKIFAGPPWDYDLAFGTELRGHNSTSIWAFQQAPLRIASDDPGAHGNRVKIFDVWKKLFNEPGFRKDLKCIWNEASKGPLGVAAVQKKIDGWKKDLTPAMKRFHGAFPGKIIGYDIFLSGFTGKTWDEDVNYVRDWTARRLKWLGENLPGTCP